MAYSDEYRGNVQETWVALLYYDNESEYIALATGRNNGAGLGMYGHPVITNSPTIRKSIDLANSSAKVGNVSLKLVNFNYKGKRFSEELIGGSRKYINRTVAIVSTLTANVKFLYTGRLTDVSHDLESISLTITDKRKTDFLTLPLNTTNNGTYIPIVYGNYTENNSYPSNEVEQNSSKLFPLTFDQTAFGNLYFISHHQIDGTSAGGGGGKGRLHVYNKALNEFNVCYEDVNSGGISNSFEDTTREIETGKHFAFTSKYLRRAIFSQGISIKSTVHGGIGSTTWGNPSYAIDGDDSTYATSSHSITKPANTTFIDDTAILEIQIYEAGAKCEEPTCEVKFILDGSFNDYGGTGATTTKLQYHCYGQWRDIPNTTHTSNSYYNNTTGLISGTETLSIWTTGGTISVSTHNYLLPNDFKIRSHIVQTGGDNANTTSNNWKLYYTKFKFNLYLPFTQQEQQGSWAYLESLDYLYCGADGLSKSWATSSLAENINDMHRDILYRNLGITSTPTNWSDLETDRANWKVRWWAVEPVDMQKTLGKLQKEGGFIYLYTATGHPKYIWVKSSYSVSDRSELLREDDISKISISNSPFSQLLTKMNIKSELHPANKKHLKSEDFANNTARTNWNIQTDENISEVKLDALCSTDAGGTTTEGYWDYYNNIFGDVKVIVKCNIVNPAKMGLDVGDIVQFYLDPQPFGYDWNRYFMVTSLTRKIGEMSIESREVG